MATNLVGTAIAASTSAPTSPETVIATLAPGTLNPSTDVVQLNAIVALVGASSVTAVTLKIRRGSAITGTLLATLAATVAGAVTIGASLSYEDTAYTGAGYCLTVQATGATATCGPGSFTAQPLEVSF